MMTREEAISWKVYGLTHSEASDWAGRWLACGMFNRTWDNIPLDGQMSLEV